MEPRPDGRGKSRFLWLGYKDHYTAAMEPRPDGRGKTRPRYRSDERQKQAAMEPRPDGRGKIACHPMTGKQSTSRNGAPA